MCVRFLKRFFGSSEKQVEQKREYSWSSQTFRVVFDKPLNLQFYSILMDPTAHPRQHAAEAPIYAFTDDVVSLEEVNELIRNAKMRRERDVTDLSQCTSSFFVLLFQAVFYKELQGLELEVNTQEKKLHNVRIVIDNVEQLCGTPLRGISPEAIIAHDEVHISRLIRVFIDIVNGVLFPEETSENMEEFEGQQEENLPAPPPRFEQWLQGIVQPDPDSRQRTPRIYNNTLDGSQQHIAAGKPQPQPQQQQPTTARHKDVRNRVRRIIRGGGIQMPGVHQHFQDPTQPSHIPSNFYAPANLHRLDSVARDTKIERLKAKRFTDTIHDRVVSAMVREYSSKERDIREQVKRKIIQQRRDHTEIIRFAKEEEKRYRDIYRDAVDTAANCSLSKFIVTEDERLTKERARLRLTKQAAARIEQQQQRALDRKYDQFISAICSWRSRNTSSPREERRG